MKKLFYKDKDVEIRVNENLDILDMPWVWLICIEAGLSWREIWCKLAKNPMKLRESCKEKLEKQIKIIEKNLNK